MSNQLFETLEEKIDLATETIELLRLEVEELLEKNAALASENSVLNSKQQQWEQSLASLLRKLEGVNLSNNAKPRRKEDLFESLESLESVEPEEELVT